MRPSAAREQVEVEHSQTLTGAAHSEPSPLEAPIGVDQDCFSPERIVQILMMGASDDEVGHLSHCETCAEILGAMSQVSLESQPGFVDHALSQANGSVKTKTSSCPPAKPRPRAAFVALPARAIRVGRPFRLSCELVPAFSRDLLNQVDDASVFLDGAVIVPENKVVIERLNNRDGKTDRLRITIEDGKLAPRVEAGVERGQRVIDTVRIHGRFKDESAGSFAAQASLEFFK